MAKEQGKVVETRQEVLPAELGGRQQLDIDPPENVVYQPMGLTVQQTGPDTWECQYLISPLKMVTIRLTGEAKALLLSKLTGGIVIPG